MKIRVPTGAVPQLTEIEIAYRKLKSHIYYESTELFQRNQLAEFESKYASNLDGKLQEVASAIGRWDTDPTYIKKLLNRHELIFLPKKFAPDEELETLAKTFITNVREDDSYSLRAVTALINIPIELQLVGVLWLMRYGFRLDKNLYSECVGNRLVLNKKENGIAVGLRLFRPYFTQYQRWRDGAVKEATRRTEGNENTAIINLDIKNFYHSIRLSFSKVEKELGIRKSDNLHEIFKEIHYRHSHALEKINLFSPGNDPSSSESVPLPIGFISSPILANWFLKDFDKGVLENVRPSYYSRYVDDILLVIPKPALEVSDKEIDATIKFNTERCRTDSMLTGATCSFKKENLDKVEKYLLRTFYSVMALVDNPESIENDEHKKRYEIVNGDCVPVNDRDTRIFKLIGVPDCQIQTSKTLLYFFDANESVAVIDKFKRDLEERSSEFRDFPDGDEIEPSFDENAYHLIYVDSEGKLNTLKDYKENRYGLSVFLAHRIFSSLRRIKEFNSSESDKLSKLFRGINTLIHFRLWEKIFTFFLVNEDKENFVEFYKHTSQQIQKIKLPQTLSMVGLGNVDIWQSLNNYLDYSLRMALALNPDFIKKDDAAWEDVGAWDRPKILRFRLSNMIRHHYVIHPLQNYLPSFRKGNGNLVEKRLSTKEYAMLDKDDPWDKHAKSYSPRGIKFWECCIASASIWLINNQGNPDIGDSQLEYLNDAADLYDEVNTIEHAPLPSSRRFFSRTQETVITHANNISVNELFVNADAELLTKPRLAFANIKLNYDFFLASMRGTPTLSEDRYVDFAKIVNTARQEKDTNFLLLPECSIPHDLISMFAQYSQKNQMAVIGGLEHWRIADNCFNFIVSVLPFQDNGKKDAVVVYRLKNHYSLSEIVDVERNHCQVPKPSPYRYDFFNWRGVYFVPYYCAELADIVHRSLFRAKCDLIIASEWNKDTNYFSNIVESLSRDVHAYVAQVNNSHYGDPRLTQPAKTEIKDLLRLKGGINTTVLIGELDIPALRAFQRLAPRPSSKDDLFKPLPPDFNVEYVLKRIENKRMV